MNGSPSSPPGPSGGRTYASYPTHRSKLFGSTPRGRGFRYGLSEPLVVPPGPQFWSHWKLDETSPGDAIDAEGPWDGSVFGATIDQAGAIDRAYRFDGTNDYIDLGTKFDGEFITVSAWINADFPYTLLNFPTIIGAADDFLAGGWLLYYQGVDDIANADFLVRQIRVDVNAHL